MIIGLTNPEAENQVDTAIERWEQLSTHITSIIGDGGFNSLYARSVHLTQATFPWLLAGLQPMANQRFAALKASLQGQTTALANAANQLLLITFTGILVSLIGAHLTTRILSSAWGVAAEPGINKDDKNE